MVYIYLILFVNQSPKQIINHICFVRQVLIIYLLINSFIQVIQKMSKNFNIQETVHRNIEKNQFPSFANHRSLVGWCSMNYPKVLQNPIYIQKDTSTQTQKFDIDTLFQQKNPIDRTKNQFIKPFTSLSEKVDEKGVHTNTKTSCFTLATSKHDNKVKIFEENNKVAEQFSAIRPLGSILGVNKDGNYQRKVRQIGQVYYNPPNEGQLMRHLKKLPNTIINEHNLLQIMDQRLEYLDLQYKTDISNELINKIGYLAPNIKELNLTSVPITNEVLIELGISCKFLESIDISLCNDIDDEAIKRFIKNKPQLKKFSANHLEHSITDECLVELGKCEYLNTLHINFCKEVTSAGIDALSKKQFVELGLANLPNLKGEDFSKLFMNSAEKLTYLNMSFNPSKQINNALMIKVGMCLNLKTLILTGCEHITDQGMNNLIYGDKLKGKSPEGYQFLHTLKIGGLVSISDQLYQLLKRCPSLNFLECNNLERLSDHFLDQVKSLSYIKTVLMNFTPNISQEKLKEVKETTKGITFIRNIIKMTDPADDGLRMPIPPASLKIKKPKKKKK